MFRFSDFVQMSSLGRRGDNARPAAAKKAR